jgi:hypothetical protein
VGEVEGTVHQIIPINVCIISSAAVTTLAAAA